MRPDSAVARLFSELVDRLVAHPKDVAARTEISRWLRLWANNDARLQPIIKEREILNDAKEPSALLAHISTLALNGKTGPELQAALKPVGEVNIAVAPAIAKLAATGIHF